MSFEERVETFKALTEELLEQESLILTVAAEMINRKSDLIVCTGIGKSSIMAERMSATLRSIGMRACHIDGGQFSHGDFGILSEGKFQLIAISNSGETQELLELIQNCRRHDGIVISISGNKFSSLAQISDLSIINKAGRSLDYLGFLPTYSLTAVSMIIDVLVMEICEKLELTANDFLANHHSGHLGSRLSNLIDDSLISVTECAVVDLETELVDVAEFMSKRGNGLAVVLSKSKDLVGVISDGDIRRAFTSLNLKTKGKASDLVSQAPITIEAGSTVAAALSLMNKNSKKNVSALPVMSQGKFIGIVTLKALSNRIVS